MSKIQSVPVAEEAGCFFTKATKPHYLSHAVRALSDDIDKQLKYFVLKNQQEQINQLMTSDKSKKEKDFRSLQKLYSHGILRLFEIKLIPNKDLIDIPARVRVICLNKGKENPYGHLVAKVEYDPQAFNSKENEDAEKKLRLLIAHELGHIFLLKEDFLKFLKGNLQTPENQIFFNSKDLPPDHEAEIEAWQIALALIHHKDEFYRLTAPKFCYCCQSKIFDICLNELIDHVGAKNKLKRYYFDLKNKKKLNICTNCSDKS